MNTASGCIVDGTEADM